jgi:hypothetical protein
MLLALVYFAVRRLSASRVEAAAEAQGQPLTEAERKLLYDSSLDWWTVPPEWPAVTAMLKAIRDLAEGQRVTS